MRSASGNSRIDLAPLLGRRVKSVRSWGKHFLVEFSGFSLRVHMLMFGSYRIDERKPSPPRVSLQFDNGELNIYASSVKYIDGALEALNQGDTERHDALVIEAAQWLARQGCDVIALAQFSMARAAPLLRRQLPAAVSVLTTPDSAVAALRRRLAPLA